jgi:hypothetical protein
VIEPVWAIPTAFTVAEMVFTSATVELTAPVATPLALVVPPGCVRVLPPGGGQGDRRVLNRIAERVAAVTVIVATLEPPLAGTVPGRRSHWTGIPRRRPPTRSLGARRRGKRARRGDERVPRAILSMLRSPKLATPRRPPGLPSRQGAASRVSTDHTERRP